jgi:hypothetical protein
LAIVVFLAVLVHRDVPLSACTCGPVVEPCRATWLASAVFLGEVVDIARAAPASSEQTSGHGVGYYRLRVRLRVLEAFHGVEAEAKTIDVYTADTTPACGYPFQRGRAYLVYAHEAGGADRLTTNVCSRTRVASAAAADIDYLRATMRRRVDRSELRGRVTRRLEISATAEPKPLPGALVRLTPLDVSNAGPFETRTGFDGRYVISVPPGRYAVTLEVGDGLTATPARPIVHLLDSRGCREANFSVYSVGRVNPER